VRVHDASLLVGDQVLLHDCTDAGVSRIDCLPKGPILALPLKYWGVAAYAPCRLERSQ
jgi:hypothetical protein